MSTYNTKHGAGDLVWYLNSDFKAKQGIVESVMLSSTLVKAAGKGNTYEVETDGRTWKVQTYVQYAIDGQHMHEGRVFSSIEDLIEHVRDDSK